MRLSTLSLGLVALGALALLSPAAKAQISTVSSEATINYTTTDFALPLVVDKFNSSLGTLLSVQIDMSTRLISDITVTNIGTIASDGTVSTRLFAWLQDPWGQFTDPAVNAIGIVQPGSFVAVAETPEVEYGVPVQLAAGDSVDFNDLEGSATKTDTFTDPGFLINFNGSAGDTLTFTGKTDTFTRLTFFGGNTSAEQDTVAEMKVKVTYTYNSSPPIPEPSTMGLLALGLSAGTVALRRRRA
jgi:hypothetical protein